MRSFSTLALIVSSAFLFTACSSVRLDERAPVEDRTSSAVTTPASTSSRTVETVNAGSADPLDSPQGVLAKRSIYFDYDSFIVKDEFAPIVAAHGKYLAANKNRKIVIQGNTDERGGREYNLALGQKRAESVRSALGLMGVSDAQIEAVSFGKEKPKATGSDEAAWAENRRADIVYQ